MALGWCFPNAVMQYAVPDLDKLSIDQVALARRRDPLREVLLRPDIRFFRRKVPSTSGLNGPRRSAAAMECTRRSRRLRHPGSIMNAPSYFRISLTASDEMVERALPAFTEVAYQTR